MQIYEEIRDNVIVLKVDGQMTIQADADLLRDRIKSLARFGINRLVVDFSHVDRFGTSMIAVLIEGLTVLQNGGGDLRLTGVGRSIKRVLALTGLKGIFRVFNRTDEGVERFQDEDVRAGEPIVA